MMEEFQHILVPVDGSEPSVRALEKAVYLAEKCGSQVTLLTVVDMNKEISSFEQVSTGGYVPGELPGYTVRLLRWRRPGADAQHPQGNPRPGRRPNRRPGQEHRPIQRRSPDGPDHHRQPRSVGLKENPPGQRQQLRPPAQPGPDFNHEVT